MKDFPIVLIGDPGHKEQQAETVRRLLRQGEEFDGRQIKRRCPSCGAFKVKGRCPVDARDCGR